MAILNVNIASASLPCCGQYGIIMLWHNNVFRGIIMCFGHLNAFLLVHGSHNHTLSQRDCHRYISLQAALRPSLHGAC